MGLSNTTWLWGVVVATVRANMVVGVAELALADTVVEVRGWLLVPDDPIARKLEII